MSRLTKEQLIAFEEDIAATYDKALIRAPVHLYNGNEDQIIGVFERNKIGKDDWVFCSWRSHYQCLLKGVPPERLKEDIIKGRSISLCYPEYNIFSSAIVTGQIPIAVGAALALKIQEKPGKVYCFMGDMTSETGAAYECVKYAIRYGLPMKFIIEDNGKSVLTETRKVWNVNKLTFEDLQYVIPNYVEFYRYQSKWPHAGAGKRIQF
jgi:TPP-dependent pyruvate/acetoin dehydrogenase alpha subunit